MVSDSQQYLNGRSTHPTIVKRILQNGGIFFFSKCRISIFFCNRETRGEIYNFPNSGTRITIMNGCIWRISQIDERGTL